MREHMGLYRGKQIDNDAWVEGFYYVIPESNAFANTTFYMISTTDCYYDYEVDPNTVGECTGLPDKNGKLIFEGDIVESEFTKMPYLVCFGEYTYTNDYGEEECACGWYNKDSDDIVTGFGCPETWATVIGNVVDNPELLEGGANHAAD